MNVPMYILAQNVHGPCFTTPYYSQFSTVLIIPFSNSVFLTFTVYVCFSICSFVLLFIYVSVFCLFILLFHSLTVFQYICPYFLSGISVLGSYLCLIYSILVLLASNQLIKRRIQKHLMVKVSNFIKSIDLLFNLDKVI